MIKKRQMENNMTTESEFTEDGEIITDRYNDIDVDATWYSNGTKTAYASLSIDERYGEETVDEFSGDFNGEDKSIMIQKACEYN